MGFNHGLTIVVLAFLSLTVKVQGADCTDTIEAADANPLVNFAPAVQNGVMVIDHQDDTSSATFKINGAAGAGKIKIIYFNGSTANRRLTLVVNSGADMNLIFPSTTDWGVSGELLVDATFIDGENTVILKAMAGQSGPNVSQLTFTRPCPTSYPDVKIVDVNTADNPLATLKTKCGSGYRLVSIQSAEHVIWLSNKVEQLKGKTYLTQGKGIPLGYDYNQNNQYWDLNDQTRSVQAIFDKLRTDHSWGGDYQSDQTTTQQWYAGFGWSYHGIEDWAPVGHNHVESAIICEKETITTCTPNEIVALPADCKCGSTASCAAGKFCYDGGCEDAAKYPMCTADYHKSLAATCVCGAAATTACNAGQWCYDNQCKTTSRCDVRPENQKNIFYGAKVYGDWNATSKYMTMNFTVPWDITVNSITWRDAPQDTLKYLKASKGLWTKDDTKDPCKPTLELAVPQTTFFGSGSKFKIKGSQLSTALRIDATEVVKTVKNGQTYTYDRNIKNSVPVLVNLITQTTINVRFRSTIAPPGPGPAPKLEDFVLFIDAEDNFADDVKNVKITMQVHSRSCINHTIPDSGVRVKTGADNIAIGQASLFNWKKHPNNTVIRAFEHNLCVEELQWTFIPRKYKDTTYEIELEFDLEDDIRGIHQKFTTIAAIDIQQADVLADVGFTSAIKTYNDSNCTTEASSFHLGQKFYSKISLTDLVVDTNNITCNTYKIKQTKNGNEQVTDMKNEVKYAFMEKKAAGNIHICGAELESHHFHVSVDGYDTILETEILITYDQTNTRRHLLQLPLNEEMFATFDENDEYNVGATPLSRTDQEFRNTKRSPDTDDMVTKMIIDVEEVKAVGAAQSSQVFRSFKYFSFIGLAVGVTGFAFGYSSSKFSSADVHSQLIEMK